MAERVRDAFATYRKTTGETQKALAARLGIGQPHLSLIVAGKRRPRLALALRIAKETGIPLETFVDEAAS